MKVYPNHDVLLPEGVSRSINHKGISRVPEIFILKVLHPDWFFKSFHQEGVYSFLLVHIDPGLFILKVFPVLFIINLSLCQFIINMPLCISYSYPGLFAVRVSLDLLILNVSLGH